MHNTAYEFRLSLVGSKMYIRDIPLKVQTTCEPYTHCDASRKVISLDMRTMYNSSSWRASAKFT